ncbi:AAA family ATPase [Candidatus Pacearchaeota archaeon]|nr:AAA family ATPase [Candidatus Pacearchaeota archaeon]
MQLNKIKLNNIRSYKEQELEFPEGSTLLSGDIGAGKTSILLAIEFALFGIQPGQRGSSILKNGKDTGGVVLDFEVEDKQVRIERTLKRSKKSISQDYCAIEINGEKFEKSVTELKNMVLELLNYPREFSRKQNILYRFTVYTPQEQMKEIILQDSKTRLNTLRHVFGIDKYKTILENTSTLLSEIRSEKRLKQGMTSELSNEKETLTKKKDELETKRYNLRSIEKELFSKKEVRKKAQEEKEEIAKKIEEKNKIQSEIEKTKIMVNNKQDSITSNEKTIKNLQEQIAELEKLEFDESRIKSLEEELKSLKEEKQDLNEKNLDTVSQIKSLTMKNKEHEDLKNKISSLKMCPTCLQDVDPVHKSNVSNKMESNIVENVKEIENFTLEKRKLSKSLSEIDTKISDAQNKIQELKVLQVRLQSLKDKKTRIEEIKKNQDALEKDIALLKQHNDSLRKTVFELNKYDNIFEEKKKKFDEASKEERLAEIKVAELKKEIDVFMKQIEEMKQKIKKQEKIKEELNRLSEIEAWLNKNFVPLISNVEQNVMIKLRSEFSQLFSQWFSMLVSDSFNVMLDDSFSPIVEYQDYEIDYDYLSGGERTAVALAYRLALNQVINSLLSKIKTHDLIILDEPTDGFSSNQLDKMREVLDELDVGQLIVVSHEQRMEDFMENVIKLKKEKGVSGKG